MSVTLSNIPFNIGQVNGSGIGKFLYFIPFDAVTAWPTISDNLEDAASVEAYNNYTGDFTFASGKTAIRIYNTQGEGSMSAEPTGERDSKMYTNKVSFRFPKLTPSAMTLANAVVNGDGFFIAWHDGAYRIIGDPHYRCDVTPNVGTGDTAGSSKGITFTAECPGYKALPIYSGDLVLPDGSLDCGTDTFTPTPTP